MHRDAAYCSSKLCADSQAEQWLDFEVLLIYTRLQACSKKTVKLIRMMKFQDTFAKKSFLNSLSDGPLISRPKPVKLKRKKRCEVHLQTQVLQVLTIFVKTWKKVFFSVVRINVKRLTLWTNGHKWPQADRINSDFICCLLAVGKWWQFFSSWCVYTCIVYTHMHFCIIGTLFAKMNISVLFSVQSLFSCLFDKIVKTVNSSNIDFFFHGACFVLLKKSHLSFLKKKNQLPN